MTAARSDRETVMSERKQSFFKAVLAQILSSASPVDGGYIFDLHGRWRYESRPPERGTCR